jgi:hypothetical protein
MFVAVMAITIVLQVLIVQFGGQPFNLALGGLNANQWVFCLVSGGGGFVWQMFINVAIVVFFPSSKASQQRELLAKRADSIQAAAQAELEREHVPQAKSENLVAQAKWHALRHGVRHGRVYARAFNSSLRSGINMSTIARTSQKAALDRSLSVALAKSGLLLSTDELDC